MRVTEYGQKQISGKEFRLYLLDLAIRHLCVHRTKEKDLEDTLSFIVARHLGGTDDKNYVAVPPDTNDIDEFEVQNAALIKPVVHWAIETARPARKEMGLE